MRRKIKFQELVNSYTSYSDEMLFEIFRWMIKTGWGYQSDGRWGNSGVFEWLYGLSSVGSQFYWFTHGFSDRYTWRKTMKLAFVRAVVSMDCLPVVSDWRKTEKVSIDKYRILDLRIAPYSECKINDLLDKDWAKKKLTTQLNSCWKDAVNIDNIILTTNGDEWRCDLEYGFDHSSWRHRLADQGENSFSGFIDEALENISILTA